MVNDSPAVDGGHNERCVRVCEGIGRLSELSMQLNRIGELFIVSSQQRGFILHDVWRP